MTKLQKEEETETKFSGYNGAGLKSGAASGSATLVAGPQWPFSAAFMDTSVRSWIRVART